MPEEYCYGEDERIITSLELDKKFSKDDASLKKIKSAAFIQCVGSREPGRMYCSRVCCTHSIENAIELKERNPDMNIYILYRDIRTYGEKEYLYKKARQLGVIFIRYSLDNKPKVSVKDQNISIVVTDHILNRPVELNVDLLTLATAILPCSDEKLANFFKVPMNEDGFFIERHAKLGPAEFATDGVFLCGMAHYPKPIDESIAQAKAAVSRAVTLLSREHIYSSGTIAQVDQINCAACGVCVAICPYSAPSFAQEGRFAGKAEINPALCKGCGLCVASCRSGAIHLKGFDTDQIMSQIFEMSEAI
jgi:heterodisulfide reductase subunit A